MINNKVVEKIATGMMGNERHRMKTLARLYSEDKASAIKGGELDFMGRGMLDPAYANVAFSLQDPKKVSKNILSF